MRAEMLQTKQKQLQENKPNYFYQKTSQNIQYTGQANLTKKVIFYLDHNTFVKVCYNILWASWISPRQRR